MADYTNIQVFSEDRTTFVLLIKLRITRKVLSESHLF